MKRIGVVIAILFVAILSGCAPSLVAREAPLVEKKELNFLHTPVESLGIRVTENILQGKIFVVAGTFPERAFSEEYPGRISWKGWIVNLETEQEFFAQVVRAGVRKEDGTFVEYFVSDSNSLEAMKGNGVLLSSDLSWIADLAGNIFPLNSVQWQSDKKYRVEMVRRCGSPLRNAPMVNGFEKTLTWNRYSLKGIGEIFSPYGDKSLKEIAAINPAYNLLEKIALKGNLTLYTDPVAIAANIALNIIVGSMVKSEGWDYTSNLPNREVMGSIIEFVGKFRKDLIRELNQQISISEERRISNEKPSMAKSGSAGASAGSSSKSKSRK